VDKFFHTAWALGIGVSGVVQQKLINMKNIKKLGSHDDDTTATIEIFFTQQAIDQLQKADASCGSRAFQQANGLSELLDNSAHAQHLLERYFSLKEQWFSCCNSRATLSDLKEEYEEVYERNFSEDYKNFSKAKRFGALVHSFSDAKNGARVKDFFAYLGKSEFSYEEILIALSELVGRSNMLVHKLCISGGHVNLESIDEGEIIHPRDQAVNLFNRVNSAV
jgi:hypothetical protein